MPKRAALPITSRLSEVPIGVCMPPIWEANVIGMRTLDGDMPERSAALVRIGIISTTSGVLLVNALMTGTISSTTPSASSGLVDQRRLTMCPTGASGPVAASP